MAYEVNTLAELLQRTNEERYVERSDVRPSVLRAKVWHAIASYPGCLGDNHSVARNREHALSEVAYWLDDGFESQEYSARYVRGQLRRFGYCELRDGRIITLEQHTASELF